VELSASLRLGKQWCSGSAQQPLRHSACKSEGFDSPHLNYGLLALSSGSGVLLTLVSRSLSEPGGQHAHGCHGDLRPFPQDALDVAVSEDGPSVSLSRCARSNLPRWEPSP
jgi:hypothetical protein